MSANREIVTRAFAAWMDGAAYVTSIFADDMTWEIAGRSAASGKYASTRQFVDEVLHPFGALFSAEEPFRPVNIRGLYDSIAFNELWASAGLPSPTVPAT